MKIIKFDLLFHNNEHFDCLITEVSSRATEENAQTFNEGQYYFNINPRTEPNDHKC